MSDLVPHQTETEKEEEFPELTMAAKFRFKHWPWGRIILGLGVCIVSGGTLSLSSALHRKTELKIDEIQPELEAVAQAAVKDAVRDAVDNAIIKAKLDQEKSLGKAMREGLAPINQRIDHIEKSTDQVPQLSERVAVLATKLEDFLKEQDRRSQALNRSGGGDDGYISPAMATR